jgi:hypothetical protein
MSAMYDNNLQKSNLLKYLLRGRRGHDRMVVGFPTACAIIAYHQ